MMKVRIDEIGTILDDQISKSLLSRKRPSISDYEDIISKSITFNPFNIREINSSEESDYYTPYDVSIDGGFYPHSVQHWADQGKNPEDYRDVHDFYSKLGVAQDSMDAFKVIHGQKGRFSFLKRSLDYEEEEIVIENENIYIDEIQKSELFINTDIDIGKYFISNNIFKHFILDLPGIDGFFIMAE